MLYVFLLLCAVLCVNGRNYISENKEKHPEYTHEWKYKVPKHSVPSRIPKQITINIRIDGDNTLIAYLKKTGYIDTKGKTIIKALKIFKDQIIKHTNNAEILMNHQLEFVKINLNLLSVQFLTKRANFFEVNTNAQSYWRNYCKWQSTKKNETMFFSILLTGLQLESPMKYDENGKKRRTTGKSSIGGVCKLMKSCAVIEMRPLNLDYLIAHELGHSLGIYHDHKAFNDCVAKTTLMAPNYVRGSKRKGWSACNKRDLKRFLMKKTASCLRR